MSAAIGIKAQPSRFAVLMKESDSDDDETETKEKSRIQPNFKGATKPNKKSELVSLKNAKKRARRKKNQSKGSQHEELHKVGRIARVNELLISCFSCSLRRKMKKRQYPYRYISITLVY